MLLRTSDVVNTAVSVLAAVVLTIAPVAAPAWAQTASSDSADEAFLAARDAYAAGNRERLAAMSARLDGHPLAPYAEFWQLTLRLRDGETEGIDADVRRFFARHADTYIADRLRMEWLRARGARGDFAGYEREAALQIWNHDDEQVACYRALARLDGAGPAPPGVEADVRRLLLETRDVGGDGCMALAERLIRDGYADPWERVRVLVEQNRYATAKRIAEQIPQVDAREVSRAIDKPEQWLAAHERRLSEAQRELALVALARLARSDPEQAARYASALNLHLTPEQRGIVWGRIGHIAAYRGMPEALDWYRRGGRWVGMAPNTARADEVLEWQVRTALRGDSKGPDWQMVRSTVERMPPDMQRDPAWVFWRGRALAATGRSEEATQAYRSIAGQHHFYGKLAAEELGEAIVLPPRAPAPAPEAVAVFYDNAGLARALKFYALGLRGDGNREWNWQTRGMDDRQLLALAEFARRQGLIDRMISTSDRTRELFDFSQRFPSPHRERVTAHAQAAGLDETWVYGLIRQESRFIADARSSAGARGLMQLMPATARYVARKVGMKDYRSTRIADLDVNLQLGTSYLRMVLDDLDDVPLLAAAGYNAGPRRPRQWRAQLTGPVEGAIFIEAIPFNETRDYVKKVMSNSVYYAALFDNSAQSLKARLDTVAPKPSGKTEVP